MCTFSYLDHFILLYVCLGVLPSLVASTMAPAVTNPTLPPHSCLSGQFVCGTYGECVSHNKVCDFRWDCSDGSDEKGCGMSVLIFISIYQSLHPNPLPTYTCSLFLSKCSVMERCHFEGGNLCGWNLDSPKPPVQLHAFQWLIGQGETIYHGEENHRPVNDHTL